MVVVVVLYLCDERDDPHRTPIHGVSTVILPTEQYLVDNPEQKGEGVDPIPQNEEAVGGGELDSDNCTMLKRM